MAQVLAAGLASCAECLFFTQAIGTTFKALQVQEIEKRPYRFHNGCHHVFHVRANIYVYSN